MITAASDPAFQHFFVLFLWPLLSAVILWRAWRNRWQTVGFVPVYLVQLWLQYWLTAFIYLYPGSYQLREDAQSIMTGFFAATFGLVAFAFGYFIAYPWLLDLHGKVVARNRSLVQGTHQQTATPFFSGDRALVLAGAYLFFGAVFHFASTVINNRINLLDSLFSGASFTLFVGLLILWHEGLQNDNRRTLSIALALSLLWPVVHMITAVIITVVFQNMLVVWLYPLWRTKRLRPVHLFGVLVAVMVGLSFFATWMRSRDDIRDAVWTPDQLAAQDSGRLANFSDLITNFEVFDFGNPQHIEGIDRRQQLPYFTGVVIERIERGEIELGYGRTLWDGLLVIVPRALWPDKPVRVGGHEYVVSLAGSVIGVGGSFGTGLTLEFYYNGALPGLIVGFIAFGILIALIDERSARNLRERNWAQLALWVAFGIAFMQVEFTWVAMMASALSSLIAIFLFNHVLQLMLETGHQRR